MIQPSGHKVRCDHSTIVGGVPRQCQSRLDAFHLLGSAGLYAQMEAARWQRGVKLDGTRARRGGKDYCSKHRRSA